MIETEYAKIAGQAVRHPRVMGLMSRVNTETLRAAHKRQQRRKATGIDRVTKDEYGENLEGNLENLVGRLKRYAYRPLPVRRTYIPKDAGGKLRPLGIPAYEDRLVQGVMTNALTQVYETKFLDISYGFRPKRDCHQAVQALCNTIFRNPVNWVVDADIKGFFDNVNHEWLVKFLEHDIADKNFIRYVKRFLKSGVMERGEWLETDKGTPQGGLISPVLANVYLHYVLDLWFTEVVRKRCRGYAAIVRYADDFVCCFQYEWEARAFYEALGRRFAKFGLELAADKSKVIRFGRFARRDGGRETFDFLGFTFVNGTTRKGTYKVALVTSRKKLKAKMAAVKAWLMENRHVEKQELLRRLNVKLVGHYRYYGVTGNGGKLSYFREYVWRMLYKSLNSRSQRHLPIEKYERFLKFNPIANPKIYHIWT